MLTIAAVTLFLQTSVAMIELPAGRYQPLYGRADDAPTEVESFRMDRNAVTRGEFAEFVRNHPEWSRSKVRPVFANRLGYLADWASDTDAGDATTSARPVTGVSWFAARAYCASRSSRLPTVAEWEYAAGASQHKRYASRDASFIQYLVSLYAMRASVQGSHAIVEQNVYGLRGMHGVQWEWVEDFNSVLVSDDSRSIGERDHNVFCASAAIGAVDPNNYPAFLRYAFRGGLTAKTSMETLGFRCAAN